MYKRKKAATTYFGGMRISTKILAKFYRCPIWQYILNNNFFMVEKVNKLTSYCQIRLLINSTINHLKRSNFGTVVVLGAASAFVSFELFIGILWLCMCVSVCPNFGRCIQHQNIVFQIALCSAASQHFNQMKELNKRNRQRGRQISCAMFRLKITSHNFDKCQVRRATAFYNIAFTLICKRFYTVIALQFIFLAEPLNSLMRDSSYQSCAI